MNEYEGAFDLQISSLGITANTTAQSALIMTDMAIQHSYDVVQQGPSLVIGAMSTLDSPVEFPKIRCARRSTASFSRLSITKLDGASALDDVPTEMVVVLRLTPPEN